MIIGHGDITIALKEIDREDRIFFASGVSNSRETRESEFQREKHLLLECGAQQQVVYFSSFCVFYSGTAYAAHKREMEQLVKTFPKWTIVRLGNIDWGTNPNTLINHLRACANRGERLEIQDAYRYIVDRDEFLYWVEMIPSWSCEMNIPGRRMTVAEIAKEYVYPVVEVAALTANSMDGWPRDMAFLLS